MNTEKEVPIYSISNAAALAGISVHTLRMYEKEGLIIPYKKASKQRSYSLKDIERIKCIRNFISLNKVTIEGLRRFLALVPCWAIIKCNKKDRKNCQAYSGYMNPCWMLNHKNNICEGKDCRLCKVYKDFSSCSSLKDKLKELLV